MYLLNSKEIAKRALLLADEKRTLRKRGRVRLILAAIVVVAAILAIAAIPAFFPPGIEMENEPTPLAAPDMVYFPNMDSLTVSVDTADARILLENPDGNGCYFIFEIILADAGEILYVSAPVSPGEKIESVRLTRQLEKGEYKATLNIRAYAIGGIEEIDAVSSEFILNVNYMR